MVALSHQNKEQTDRRGTEVNKKAVFLRRRGDTELYSKNKKASLKSLVTRPKLKACTLCGKRSHFLLLLLPTEEAEPWKNREDGNRREGGRNGRREAGHLFRRLY